MMLNFAMHFVTSRSAGAVHTVICQSLVSSKLGRGTIMLIMQFVLGLFDWVIN